MSKTTIFSVLAVGAIIVGGYFVFNMKPMPESAQLENSEMQNEVSGETSGKKMAFSEFIKQDKGAYKCEVKQAFSDIENKGTVYMNNGMMRGEFTTVAEGKTMDSSFIMKDGYAYNWSSVLPNMGVKVKVLANTENKGGDAKGTYTWNAEQIGEYNCEEWKVDESKFALPVGIDFTEINS